MRSVLAFFLLTGAAFAGRVQCQNPQPQDDIQSWNDIQLTVPIDKNFELYTSLTGRFGKNVTRLSDGRTAVGINWKATKSLSVLPFYGFIRARNSNGQFRNEHRLNLRATLRVPLGRFEGVHRSTYEYRIREPLNSWRYRGLLGIEREIPKSLVQGMKWFVNDEVFYDSILDRFSRNRLSVGINRILSKKLSVDVYYMRQNDGFSRPGDLHVLGTTWRLKT